MGSNKDQKFKKRLASANKSNQTPPIWVMQRTEDLKWHPMRRRSLLRNWRRNKLSTRIRKNIEKNE
ncbi:MAG: 50S ribosomal protein L39e [archaeon]